MVAHIASLLTPLTKLLFQELNYDDFLLTPLTLIFQELNYDDGPSSPTPDPTYKTASSRITLR